MEKYRSIQEIVRSLKEDSKRISECLIKNQCMAGCVCMYGNDSLSCYNQLEANRNTIDDINEKIVPS